MPRKFLHIMSAPPLSITMEVPENFDFTACIQNVYKVQAYWSNNIFMPLHHIHGIFVTEEQSPRVKDGNVIFMHDPGPNPNQKPK